MGILLSVLFLVGARRYSASLGQLTPAQNSASTKSLPNASQRTAAPKEAGASGKDTPTTGPPRTASQNQSTPVQKPRITDNNSNIEALKQIESANSLFRNGPLSNAGRALTKHPNIVNETGNILQKLGGAKGVNDAAAKALLNIMENGIKTTKMTKAFGQVIDYKLANGLGARFSATTNEFITFLGRGIG